MLAGFKEPQADKKNSKLAKAIELFEKLIS